MLEYLYNTLKNSLRKLDMKLERAKYGYIEKLPKEIQYFDGGLYDLVYETACKRPHNIAMQYYNLEVSYKDLIKKINKVATALKAIGVEKGDYVTICMPNTPEAVYTFYAISEVGAIANMIHPLSSEKEIEDYLNQAHSKFMLCIDVSYHKVEAIIKNTEVEQLVVVSATRSMDFIVRALYKLTKGRKNHVKSGQRVLTWGRFLLKGNKYLGNPHARVNAEDPAVIFYTGGTTGTPKGVVITNYNLNTQAIGAKHLVAELLKPKNSILTFLPNFHAFGLGVCIHVPFYCGMRIVLIPQFNAKKLKQYIQRYRINVVAGVPAVFEHLLKIKFGKNGLKDVRGVISGGDMMSQATKEEINDFLHKHGSKAVVHNGYGLTESSGGVIFSTGSVANKPDVVGFPLPDSEILIADPKTGEELPRGADGEILIHGLTVMKEYLNKPEETASTFTVINGKKYLKTGDIGYLDEQGLLYFKTRLKRIIITNGYNVYPATIEETTNKCAAVAKSACVGIYDKARGEKVKVFIVLKENGSERVARKELTKIYKKYLAKYEIPRELAFINELPKTKMNKIDYKALQNL